MSLKATIKDITLATSRNETTYEVEVTATGGAPSFEEVKSAALAQVGLAAKQMYPREPKLNLKLIEWRAQNLWLVTLVAKPA
jgi:hypothetical protein